MELRTERLYLRDWREEDKEGLLVIANNRKIWRNLMDIFPHPYTSEEADKWIEINKNAEKKKNSFVIIYNNVIVGGIGFDLQKNNHCKTATIGYWLGEPYWGKGIASEALVAVTAYAFNNFDIERIEAAIFEWNPASARVLEKCGYLFEGKRHNNIFKDDEITSELFYYMLRENFEKKQIE